MSCFTQEYVPTVIENYSSLFDYQGSRVSLSFWDTPGNAHGMEFLQKMGPQIYEGTDGFLVFFDVTSPKSLSSVQSKWIDLIKEQRPEAPIFILGSKSDLRDNKEVLESLQEKPVLTEYGSEFSSKVGSVGYFEVSAMNYDLSKKVITEVVKTILTLKSQKSLLGRCSMCYEKLTEENTACDGPCGQLYCNDCIEIWKDGYKSCLECGKLEAEKRELAGQTYELLKPRLIPNSMNFQVPPKKEVEEKIETPQ